MLKRAFKFGCVPSTLLILAAAAYIMFWLLPSPAQANVSTELSEMYAEDQVDRAAMLESFGPVSVARLTINDWIRVNRVIRIVDADLLNSQQDYTNAANILQHGSDSSHYLLAYELALKAYELGDRSMLRNSALAEDRYLESIGELQKYGSQYFCSNGLYSLFPVDPTVSDEDRAAVNIAPLAVWERRMEILNSEIGTCTGLDADMLERIEAIVTEQQ